VFIAVGWAMELDVLIALLGNISTKLAMESVHIVVGRGMVSVVLIVLQETTNTNNVI
jgi:hypothetical protein